MSIDHEGNRRKWEKLLFSTIHIIQVHDSFRAVKRTMNLFQINSIALLQKFQEPGISQRGLLVLQRLLILLMLLRKVKPVIIGHLVSRLRSLGWWWIVKTANHPLLKRHVLFLLLGNYLHLVFLGVSLSSSSAFPLASSTSNFSFSSSFPIKWSYSILKSHLRLGRWVVL